MLSIQIDSTGDILLDDRGNPIQVSGLEETRQEVEVYLQTNKDEWFLDPDLGINHSDFRGKNVSDDTMRVNIVDGLEQTDRFVSLDNINFVKDTKTRKLYVAFRATMTDGIVNQEVNLNVG